MIQAARRQRVRAHVGDPNSEGSILTSSPWEDFVIWAILLVMIRWSVWWWCDGGDDNLIGGDWKWRGEQAPYKTPLEEHFASRTGQNWRHEVRLGCQRACQTIKVKEPVDCGVCNRMRESPWSSVIEDWLKRFFLVDILLSGWYSFGKEEQVKRWNHTCRQPLWQRPPHQRRRRWCSCRCTAPSCCSLCSPLEVFVFCISTRYLRRCSCFYVYLYHLLCAAIPLLDVPLERCQHALLGDASSITIINLDLEL